MNDRSLRQLSNFPLVAMVALGAQSGAPALEPEGDRDEPGVARDFQPLPAYVSEEAAASRMETAIRGHAERAGVQIDSMRPREPIAAGDFVAVGVHLVVSGSAEEVTGFGGSIARPDLYRAIASLTCTTDRRDPEILRASIVIHQWHAAREGAAGKVESWRRTVAPYPPVSELFELCRAPLGDKVKITAFAVHGGTITLVGESATAHDGRQYAARLFTASRDSKHIKWIWLQRPKFDVRKGDGGANFRLQGKLPEQPPREEVPPESQSG